MKKAVCIMSGGMDSTLCAVMAKKAGYDIVALHFDYGQRTMKREKRAFNEICERLGITKKMSLDVSFIAQIGGNSLTDESLQIRKDGVEKDVPNTYVPFRNGIFISVAAALAEKENAQAIYIGVVEEDSSGYPDCKESFIKSINEAINLGTSPSFSCEIITPLELTWSCYESDDEACGLCDSCRLRLNGFKKANATDKIAYKNQKFSL